MMISGCYIIVCVCERVQLLEIDALRFVSQDIISVFDKLNDKRRYSANRLGEPLLLIYLRYKRTRTRKIV